MATIKSFTSLEQSKVLSKILPLESADMIWVLANPDLPMIKTIAYKDSEKSKYYEILPAWSLASLLDVLPKTINNETLFIETSPALWHIGYRDVCIARADNLVDACVEMIEKLHKQMIYDFNNN